MVEETYNCSEQCESLDVSIDQTQLAYRLIKLRIRVLRANIGKLLCLCVPAREKWTEFGWDGKTVDEILDDLSKIDIPVCHPGDSDFQKMFKEHEKQFMSAEQTSQQENVSQETAQNKETIHPSPTVQMTEMVEEKWVNQLNEMEAEETAVVTEV